MSASSCHFLCRKGHRDQLYSSLELRFQPQLVRLIIKCFQLKSDLDILSFLLLVRSSTFHTRKPKQQTYCMNIFDSQRSSIMTFLPQSVIAVTVSCHQQNYPLLELFPCTGYELYDVALYVICINDTEAFIILVWHFPIIIPLLSLIQPRSNLQCCYFVLAVIFCPFRLIYISKMGCQSTCMSKLDGLLSPPE